ncbi:MAG: HU family DNA-binding protein [candidate division NC10 bacterium]|jgi:DNA-binding protein HU-beta|nr:HU family DNA-binding protein [candidate division NC10 bacterium]MCH7896772.1 HU family DNA-binding protein [candidate division NC10 bacterium]MCZ6551381.1 HU family DNA-binding protein [candidate division NC10 bacterium]
MTKAELVDRMSRDAKVTKRAAEAALDSALKAVKDTLKKGKKVTLVGFGTFATGRRKARTGRNPQTGRAIKIPAARVVRFRPGASLKKAVR